MSTLIRFPVVPENIAGYRFGNAELRVASERLLLADVEVALSPMAYRFLLGLCRGRGALLTRAQAFDLLWPGGGSGSDEALAQIVLKVRQALGADGRALATVRSRGFRLDLPIEVVPVKPLVAVTEEINRPHDITVPASAASRTPPPTVEGSRPDPAPRLVARWRWLISAVAVGVFAVAIAAYFFTRPDVYLDGFAMHAQAFGPLSAPGAGTLQTALLRDKEGDRTSARQLLQTMIDSEPRSAAPVFFLMLWISGDEAEMRQWQSILQQRLPKDAPAYVQLLARWVSIGGATGAEDEIVNAALKLEPSAWQLRLARAHVGLRTLRFDAALADLRRIPLQGLVPRYAMFIMSDRAALGDADTMNAELPQLAQRAPAAADYVRGRIAAARGQWGEAQAAFEAAAQRAERDALTGALNSSSLLAATAAGMQNHWQDVQRNADMARRIGTEHKLSFLVADAEALIGYAHYRSERDDQGDANWDRAAGAFHDMDDSDGSARLWLQRARMQPAWAIAHVPPTTTDPTLPAGVSALLNARQAWLTCATDTATRALAASESAGIDNSYFADETDLLRADIGIARRSPAVAPRLPYPALTRWIGFWESGRNAGLRACALHPTADR